MSDSARVLLIAGVLSGTAMAAFAWRVARVDAAHPDRLIGELRVAQWAAILLAASAAMPMGLAVAGSLLDTAHIDVAFGFGYVLFAGLILQREPRSALLFAVAGFASHALLDIAHRPGGLSPDLAPRWYMIGAASYDLFVAAVCFWARRR